MRNRDSIGVGLALLAATSMWFYVQRVLIPYQKTDAALHSRPRGNLSDLYPRWLGARELLLHHRDPYSADVTREIQAGYYGRPLDPLRPSDPRDQQGFAYPVYVAFLLAPTIQFPFETVQTGFFWLLGLLTAMTVPLWLRVISWRPACSTLAALLLLTLGSFAVAQGIKLQQLSLLVGFLVAAAVALATSGHLALCGILLALATIKPQLALPIAAWLTVWSLGDLRRRGGFIAGFFVTLGFLVAGGEYELQGWISRFRTAVAAYANYTGGGRSLLDVLLTQPAGRAVAGVVVLLVAYLCWTRRTQPAESPGFAGACSLVLAATVVIIPTFAPYNQILLMPAIFLIARSWTQLRQRSATARYVLFITAAAVLWPWLAAFALTGASLLMPAATVQQAWGLPLFTSFGIPIGVLATLAFLLTP